MIRHVCVLLFLSFASFSVRWEDVSYAHCFFCSCFFLLVFCVVVDRELSFGVSDVVIKKPSVSGGDAKNKPKSDKSEIVIAYDKLTALTVQSRTNFLTIEYVVVVVVVYSLLISSVWLVVC